MALWPNIAPLRAATRVRRLRHSMTIRLRSCIRRILQLAATFRTYSWAMRRVWGFCEGEKSGGKLLGVSRPEV